MNKYAIIPLKSTTHFEINNKETKLIIEIWPICKMFESKMKAANWKRERYLWHIRTNRTYVYVVRCFNVIWFIYLFNWKCALVASLTHFPCRMHECFFLSLPPVSTIILCLIAYRESHIKNITWGIQLNNSSKTSTLNYVFDNKCNSVWINHVMHLFKIQATATFHCISGRMYGEVHSTHSYVLNLKSVEITLCASLLCLLSA